MKTTEIYFQNGEILEEVELKFKKLISAEHQGEKINLELEKLHNGKEIGIVYRKNNFLDSIIQKIDKVLPINLSVLPLPKGLTTLTEEEEQHINTFINLHSSYGKVFVDKTTQNLLGTQVSDWIFDAENVSESGLSKAKQMEVTLQETGKIIVEKYGLENIVLVSGSLNPKLLPFRLAEHGLDYITKNGDEKYIESYYGCKDKISTNEEYREMLDFYIENLEKYGANVYIAFDSNGKLETFQSDITYNSGIFQKTSCNVDFSNAAIIADRHQESSVFLDFESIFLQHGGVTIEDIIAGTHVGKTTNTIITDIARKFGVEFPSNGLIKDSVCSLEENLGYQDVTEIKKMSNNLYLVKLMNENGCDYGYDSLYMVKIDDEIFKSKLLFSTKESGNGYIHLDLLNPVLSDNNISVNYKGKEYKESID